MRPNYLLCKDERGQVVPFEQDGVQYVDGSLQADLPFRHISTLFSVSHFIVSQGPRPPAHPLIYHDAANMQVISLPEKNHVHTSS